jgi:hypothetical protein
MKRRMFILFILVANNVFSQTASVFVEAESFDNRGGWVIDPQFVEQMGSPYLLAHGLGKPVKDATTEIYVENTGSYHVWVRTKNWAPGNWEAPGRFLVSIDGKKLDNQLGKNPGWNLLDQDNPDFISEAMFYKTGQYSIPYRSLYSKNISNLFMAGRNFSCSHVGLGGPRVMRTTGQMGAAVGLAASVCKKHSANPRDVYTSHLDEYLELIEKQK